MINRLKHIQSVSEGDILAAAQATQDVIKESIETTIIRVAEDFQNELEQFKTEVRQTLDEIKKTTEDRLSFIQTLIQSIPTVNVNIPEQPVPNVEVTVPPPRLVDKTFSYDEHGRPLRVTEKEIAEYEVK